PDRDPRPRRRVKPGRGPSPDLAEAMALHKAGQLAEAIERYRAIRRAFPKDLAALNLLGAALIQSGDAAEALPLLEEACALAPGFAEAESNRAAALNALVRFAEAEEAARLALKAKPDYPEALNNLGNALQARHLHRDAVEAYEKSLALRHGAAETLNACGVSLKALGRLDEALAAVDKAIALFPDFPAAHSNRAAVLKELGRYEEALAACDRALALEPGMVEAWGNRAVTFAALERIEEAEAAYLEAKTLQPGHPEILWNLSMVRLAQGRLAEGWPDYEHRWCRPTSRILPHEEIPLWRGEPGLPLKGKTLLVQFEQGFGDAIQMLRYVPVLEAMGAACILEMPEALFTLALRNFPRARVIPMDAPPTGADYRIPLMSLPLALRTETVAAIPGQVPYLRPDPAAVERWRGVIRPDPRPKFGLVWRGNASHIDDRNRSARLDDFLPLLENRNALWFVLQKGLTDEENERLKAFGTAVAFDRALPTFDDTAALLEFVDVVITVDSAPAHLAGALGKRTAVLLPFHADWRWLRNRADSPWYPTARLYRQRTPGDWAGTIGGIAAEIAGQNRPRS
ncbi:MAG TPA: tetratricopeptide repeat protein, partial [Candidatus Methylacidiphilales bacterium]